MTTLELLTQLRTRGIRLWLEDDQLQYRAPQGAFGAELKDQVISRRAEIIDFLRQQNQPAVTSIVPQRRNGGNLPLSYSQQRLWFLAQYEGQPETYHCPAVIPFSFEVDLAALRAALNDVVARHESLRTTFTLQEGVPVQKIQPELQVDIPVFDLTGGTDAIPEAEQLIACQITAPFDLEQGPLLRAVLLRFGPREHYLLVCMHHIVTDGWSMGIFQQEFTGFYQARTGGRAYTPLPLPLQYADYAVWQRQQVEQRVISRQWPYWEARLKDAPRELDLPTDFPRLPIRSSRGAAYRFRFDADLSRHIGAMAEASQVTLFMLMLAIFGLLLARYTRQNDLTIGTPVANRPRVELAGLIGFFVNTLVLRLQPDPAQSFGDYLQQVRQTCLEAYEHQELPFELLVERLGGARDLSRSPLFQVMFALQNAAGSEVTVTEGDTMPLRLPPGAAKFDLNVSLAETGSELAVECEYSTDLFREETIVRLFRCYETLVRAVVMEPGRALAAYAPLPPDEQAGLLALARGPRRDYDHVPAIHRLFERQAKARPDSPALRFRETQLDYGGLNARVKALSALLQASGVRPGDIVPLMMERSVELVVAILAVLDVGAAYLPLAPDLPAQRLAFVLQDARATHVLTQRRFQARFEPAECRVLVLDEPLPDAPARMLQSPHPEDPIFDPEGPAYVIYTSGSTGVPKGVVNSHRGLHNRLVWMQENHPIGPGDRVLQKTNYAFDVSVWEFIWPLIEGATLVLAEPGGHKDPKYLTGLCMQEQVTVVHFVPSMFRVFLDEPAAAGLTSLRAIFCSGEALPWEQVAQLRRLQLPAKLYNLYGPTEAAIDVTCWDCSRVPYRDGLVPIGFPILNCDIHILDAHLNPMPPGVPGEIHIGGRGLATVYLRRQALTAERFIPDPFSDHPGARLYKTGDLGRFLPDGSIEYLGRIDLQVKLRGFRIEIGEVEAQLMSQPGVTQAAVVVARNNAGEPQLIGYVCGMAEPSALRAALSEFLPDYMVPAHLVMIDAFPLNANGKLDRKALAARGLPDMPLCAEAVQPASALQQTLQGIWADILHLEQVATDRNFFDLGGSSLLMVQVQRQLAEVLGREVSLVGLFAHPTVRGLARYLGEGESETKTTNSGANAIKAGNRRLAKLRERRKLAFVS